ncbi:MAG: signal peptidase I [Gammaproteobacteria bacterium]|nr:signal peptidase I [Gammaproteobacteria bacterium]NIM71821.1 signal peptidase I [Gammaproteobacteria bacterium]NIN37943.1 signal peptidase I [Gammaproteobacteria bacterium]NIO23577.1 signal peptidase I [Gammaproteobacteria bacterium]NIO64193.1 signal peptidase I [Gammaproteobacteria bacterium]
MVLLVLASGFIWALDALVLARRRRRAVPEVGEEGEGDAAREPAPAPKIVEYARSFFPVFLIVLLLRSFLIEPFRIPSGSMMPTLLVGDFILVNKFVYGIRLPVSDRKIIEISKPERGDVVVFRFPEDPSTPFIKRVVGLPGDRIAYYNKVLYINGQQADQRLIGTYTGHGSGASMTGATLKQETLVDKIHPILIQAGYPSIDGKTVVPEGHYFVLGDNRDNSRDSRYWGTVADELLIGKAFTIWMNWDFGNGIDWERIGMGID